MEPTNPREKSITKDVEKQASEVKDTAMKKANAGIEQAAEAAKEVTKSANVAVGHASEGARDIAKDTREAAKDVGQAAQRAAGHAAESGKRIVEDIQGGAKQLAQSTREAASDAAQAVQEVGGQVTDLAKDATERAASSVSEAARKVGPAIRRANSATAQFVANNALPISLLGFGAGWLLMSSRRKARVSEEPRTRVSTEQRRIVTPTPDTSEPRSATTTRSTLIQAEPIRDSLREGRSLIEGAKELAHDTRSSAREGAARVADEVRSQAAAFTQRAKHQYEHAREVVSERAEQFKHSASDGIEWARQSTTHLAETQPLALVALSLGVGAGTALLFPSSKPEKRLLGPTRDKFVDEASHTASRVGEIARDTARELRDEFRH